MQETPNLILGLTTTEFIQILILIVLAITGIISFIGIITTRSFRKATVRPRIWPTDIYLNPFHTGQQSDLTQKAQAEGQTHPIIKKLRRKTGERDPNVWCLQSKKTGEQLGLRGQVNFRNGGQSEARLIRVEQKFWLEGKPLSSPPVAEDIEFLCYPDQVFNADFEVLVSDETLKEGCLLYGIRWTYVDSEGRKYPEHAFFWYDSVMDKWCNNMNKVPWFKNIRKW